MSDDAYNYNNSYTNGDVYDFILIKRNNKPAD